MEKSGIETVRKSVAILDYLSCKSVPSGVTEVAKALEIPKSTAHRMLAALALDNVVTKIEGGRYRVGPTVLRWSSGYHFSSGIAAVARPLLENLRDESRETVHLSVYEQGLAQYIDRFDSPQAVALRWSRLGSTLPLYCTAAGRAILSVLPEDELNDYFSKTVLEPRTERTETSPDKLRPMLIRFRAQGYAEENQENEDGIRCVGSAVMNRAGRPVAAVSLTAPAYRFDDADSTRCGAIVSRVAREISAQI